MAPSVMGMAGSMPHPGGYSRWKAVPRALGGSLARILRNDGYRSAARRNHGSWTNTSVKIMSGKGSSGRIWDRLGRCGWSFRATICSAPKNYAPRAARTGFHPPKITMASAIQP